MPKRTDIAKVLMLALGVVFACESTVRACSLVRECDRAPVVINRLRGQIYGPERTVPGATVALYREDRHCQWSRDIDRGGPPRAKLLREVRTNDYGEFKFDAIPSGKYLLVISKDGQHIDDAEVSVLAGPDDVRSYLEIRFPTLPVQISASCGGMPSWRFSTTQGKEED